jgi:tetratricopeptide (TPR) repeat protein
MVVVDDKIQSTLQGLAEHQLWAEMIDFGMRHIRVVRAERPLLKLLVEAFCREVVQADAERAVALDRAFRSLKLPPYGPFALRWGGCRHKALGRTDYAQWMALGTKALDAKQGDVAMSHFDAALKLDPFNVYAFRGQERALFYILKTRQTRNGHFTPAYGQDAQLLEDWVPRLSKPSPAFSVALDLLTSRDGEYAELECMMDAPFDWPIPFWRKADTRPTRRHPWSLLGHQILLAEMRVRGWVASYYAGEENPVWALPDEGRGILEWAYALRRFIPPSSPARLRLSDFHRSWGSQEYADKLLFNTMKRRPGCPLAWLHLAVSFYIPHKISLYHSSLCKAALLMIRQHPLYVRTHLFLAREYHVQGNRELAVEEFRIAKGGLTRIPLERLSFQFRQLIGSLDQGPPIHALSPEILLRYRVGAKEAEEYSSHQMP